MERADTTITTELADAAAERAQLRAELEQLAYEFGVLRRSLLMACSVVEAVAER